MALWKRLTTAEDGKAVDVNMDQVVLMYREERLTRLIFSNGEGYGIRETPEEIQELKAL